MKNLIILGGGTAGTMMANKLRPKLSKKEWNITLVDRDKNHYYQPGFLFIPFGTYSKEEVVKPKQHFFPNGIDVVFGGIDIILPEDQTVRLEDGTDLSYDILIIATGTQINPDEIEGLNGPLWHKEIFDFYTFEGAVKLGNYLETWEGGRMVLNIAEMPIKCPVAPLEFVFLADDFFREKGMRDKVEIVLATPLSGAFTKPVAAKHLGELIEQKGIVLETEFNIGEVDNEKKQIVSWDERAIDFDLLVSIPTNMGDPAIERSGMGDELNFIPTNKHTLQSDNWDNIFVIGDATNLPSSKAGSVVHFQSEILTINILDVIAGRNPTASFDGHANCFIESGNGKGFLIDFNYETEPLPGKFPVPGIGPFSLLKESSTNHLGKLAFKWIYWNLLLKGKELPLVKADMSLSGKNQEYLQTA